MAGPSGRDVVEGVDTLGAHLRALRELAGLSQEELAHRAALSVDAVSALERGTRTRPHPATVRALATALQLDEAGAGRLRALVRPGRRPEVAVGELPTWPTDDLIGRAADVRELASLVRTSRLVTLSGTGGVGKSRLAAALGGLEQRRGQHRVLWIPLAAVVQPDLVLSRFADAVGARAEQSTMTSVCRRLDARPTLVVVDNFEQLVRAAPVLAELLAGTSGLRMLVTSRTTLGLRGEQEHVLAPLAVPPATATSAELGSSPAVQLLLTRIGAVRRGFVPTADDVPALAAICQATGGLPLALELAASALRVWDPQSFVTRLDGLLEREGARDLPARQSSLRATIDWSYQLLDPSDQEVFAALSVFSGGFSAEDAAAVIGPGAPEALERLVAASLCALHPASEGPPRCTMLPPIAAFAKDLLAAGPAGRLRQRHRAHYAEVAQVMAARLQGDGQSHALARFDRDEDDLWTAVTTAIDDGDGPTAARLAWELWAFWWVRGRRPQAWDLLSRLRTLRLTPLDRARVLHAWSALADRATVDPGEVHAALLEELSAAHASDDPQTLTTSCIGLGLLALDEGDAPRAVSWLEDALDHAARAGPFGQWLTRQALVFLATALVRHGDAAGARGRALEAVALGERHGDTLVLTTALHSLAVAQLRLGEPSKADHDLRRAISLTRATGDLDNLAHLLLTLASVEMRNRSDVERVVALLGAADAMRAHAGPPVLLVHTRSGDLHDEVRAVTQSQISPRTWKHAYETGRALDAEGACRLALSRP